MSQVAITKAFQDWKAKQAIDNTAVTLDEFVFAYIPGLDITKPIDITETLPASDKIVHRQKVSKAGVINDNAVLYSVTIGADVGDFDFNWIGLVNSDYSVLAMVIHVPTQRKIKNAAGQQGNVLVRSMMMEYAGAAAATEITTPAETWQIDFTARLAGIDDRKRVENVDLYGDAAFFGDGWLVARQDEQYFVTQGAGYVAGLRADLPENVNIEVSGPAKVWLDVCWTGSLTSVWGATSRLTVAEDLDNYVADGVQHYVFALASIDEKGVITDLRPKNSLADQSANNALEAHEKSTNHPDATTTGKGFVQLSSVTDSDEENLAATPRAVKAANDNAAGRVSKSGDVMSGDLTLQDLYIDGNNFIEKRKIISNADGTNSTNGLRIRGRSDQLVDIYHHEQPGIRHVLGIHVAGGGGDGWFEFWQNGEFRYSGNILATDGNIYGSAWGGWLRDYLGNYATGVRLGAETSVVMYDGNTYRAPWGCVVTGITKGGGGNPTNLFFKPIQVLINNTWITIGG